MRSKLVRLNRNIKLITANTKDYDLIEYDWLPGGIMNGFWGNIVSMINRTKTTKDELGRQISSILINRTKSVAIITIYRIP